VLFVQIKVAKKLKKNNVSVDVVNFGEDSVGNVAKLEVFFSSYSRLSVVAYVTLRRSSSKPSMLVNRRDCSTFRLARHISAKSFSAVRSFW
jgi:hypothetical protein